MRAHPARTPWWFHVISLLLVMVAGNALADAGVIDLRGLDGLRSTVSVLRDSSGQAGLKDVTSGAMSQKFGPLDQNLRVGHDDAAWWFKIKLDVPEPLVGQKAFLLVMPADLDDVRFYTPDEQEQLSGISWPFSVRKLPNLFPVLSITLTGTHVECFVRIQNSGAMALHYLLLSEPAFRRTGQVYHFVFGVSYGILLIVLVMSALNWLWAGAAIYGRYVLLVSMTALTSLTTQGYTSGYLLPEHPGWVVVLDNAMPTLLACAAIFFSFSLLRMEEHYPRFTRLWRWFALGLLVCAGLAATPYARIGTDISLLAFLTYGLCSTGISLTLFLRDRNLGNTLNFLGYLIFVILLSITDMTSLGWLSATPWTLHSWLIGTLVNLLLMLAAMAYRIRQLQLTSWHHEMALALARTQIKEERKRGEELRLFIAMLGHELGTPIAVIDSSLQCLTINSGATESDSAKWLDNIRSSVKRMDNLVRDSLSRERVDSGGWDLRRTTLSASDLADAALSDYRLDLPLSGFAKLPFQVGGVSAELSIEIPETTLTCRGDIYLLHRAVHNLLDNASKYADAGIPVRLSIERSSDNRWMRISVENEGTEIPESVLPRLFEKYFRYGDRTNVAGAGLGLYLVRQVAELHGGQATAMTLPGQKLRFELDLPIFDHPGHE